MGIMRVKICSDGVASEADPSLLTYVSAEKGRRMARVIIPIALFTIVWFIVMHHGIRRLNFFVMFVPIVGMLSVLINIYRTLVFRLELRKDFLSFQTGYRSTSIERGRIVGYFIRPHGGYMAMFLPLAGGAKDFIRIPLPCIADEAFYAWLSSSPNYARTTERAESDLPGSRPLQTYMASMLEKIQASVTFGCVSLALVFAAYLFLSSGLVSMLLVALLSVLLIPIVLIYWRMCYGSLKCCLKLYGDHLFFQTTSQRGSIPRDAIVGYSTEPGPGHVKLHVKRRDASDDCVIPIHGQFDQALFDWLAQSTGQAGEGLPT